MQNIKRFNLAALERNNNLNNSCAIVIPAININEDVEKCLQECLDKKKSKLNLFNNK